VRHSSLLALRIAGLGVTSAALACSLSACQTRSGLTGDPVPTRAISQTGVSLVTHAEIKTSINLVAKVKGNWLVVSGFIKEGRKGRPGLNVRVFERQKDTLELLGPVPGMRFISQSGGRFGPKTELLRNWRHQTIVIRAFHNHQTLNAVVYGGSCSPAIEIDHGHVLHPTSVPHRDLCRDE
jgi:hypothetical protein